MAQALKSRQTLEPYREWRGARSPKFAAKVGLRATFDGAVSSEPLAVAADAADAPLTSLYMGIQSSFAV